MLSKKVQNEINTKFPCRERPLATLCALLDPLEESETEISDSSPGLRPPVILLEGPHHTGKSSIVSALFDHGEREHIAFIDCQKCITLRSFFERTLDEIKGATLTIDSEGVLTHDMTCIESLDIFVLELQKALKLPTQENKVIVRPFHVRIRKIY